MGLLSLFWVALGCNGGTVDSKVVIDTDADDTEAPVITTTPILEAQPLGVAVEVTADVVDDKSGVREVYLYYKQETSTFWQSVKLEPTEGNTYQGSIPGDYVHTAGMHYYLSATDEMNNGGFAPAQGEADPYHFAIGT